MRGAICALLSLFVVGCGACEEEPPAEPAGPSEEVATEEEATPSGAEVPAPADGLDKERARELLESWLAAQNAGDFDAYQALYGERFEGVKRSAERTYRYDREQWLEDRQRMFSRPMQVSAEEVRVSSASEAAVIFFEQHWSSATYSDVGPKQLVLVEVAGELRIGREEMLSSRILGHGELTAPPLSSFMLVIDAGSPHLLFSSEVDEGLGRGPLTLASRSRPAAATRSVDPARLDESMRTLIGERVEVFGARGAVCTATVGPPVIVHRVVPHFGTVQHWDGDLGGSPSSDAQIAADVWELGASGALLAAPLEGEECERPLWARVAAEHHPKVFTPSLAEGGEQIRALSAFRSQPAHREIQADFRSYGAGHSGPWDSHGTATPTVVRWIEPGSGREIVTVTARAGAGCADFFGRMWSLFEKVDGDLVPRTDPSAPGAYEPRTIIDLDDDGMVEILIEDGLLRAGAEGGFTRVIDVTPPYLDCDC
jgi:ketosteroid isomerase-like protein